jgi:hypothetical protein
MKFSLNYPLDFNRRGFLLYDILNFILDGYKEVSQVYKE